MKKSTRRRSKKSSVKRSAGFATALVGALVRVGSYFRSTFRSRKRAGASRRTRAVANR